MLYSIVETKITWRRGVDLVPNNPRNRSKDSELSACLLLGSFLRVDKKEITISGQINLPIKMSSNIWRWENIFFKHPEPLFKLYTFYFLIPRRD